MARRVVAMVTRGETEGRDCSCISPTKPEVMLPETTPTGRRPSLAPGEERERERSDLEVNNYQSPTSNCDSFVQCTVKSPEVGRPVGMAETPLEGEKP